MECEPEIAARIDMRNPRIGFHRGYEIAKKVAEWKCMISLNGNCRIGLLPTPASIQTIYCLPIQSDISSPIRSKKAYHGLTRLGMPPPPFHKKYFRRWPVTLTQLWQMERRASQAKPKTACGTKKYLCNSIPAAARCFDDKGISCFNEEGVFPSDLPFYAISLQPISAELS